MEVKLEKKENAVSDYMKMIKESWTWEKLTEEEKTNFEKSVLWSLEQKIIVGNYKQRYMILHALYHTFLNGVGYTNENWRN